MTVIERVPETVVVTQSDVLTRAADLLEEDGWRSFATSDGWNGATCLIGSLYRAAYALGVEHDGDHNFAFAFLEGADSFANYAEVYRWNDEPGRTAEQVVARLRQAAEQAEAA